MVKTNYFVKFKYETEDGLSVTRQEIIRLDCNDVYSINSLMYRIRYQSNIHTEDDVEIIMLVKLEV